MTALYLAAAILLAVSVALKRADDKRCEWPNLTDQPADRGGDEGGTSS